MSANIFPFVIFIFFISSSSYVLSQETKAETDSGLVVTEKQLDATNRPLLAFEETEERIKNQKLNYKNTKNSEEDGGSNYIRYVLVIIVLTTMILSFGYLKFIKSDIVAKNTGNRIKLLERRRLSANTFLTLVDIDNKVYIIAENSGNIDIINQNSDGEILDIGINGK